MIKVKGKYTSAIVYTDVIEEKALQQIQSLCDQAYAKDNKIRIMPDVHAGAGCTIGTTMEITDSVVPNLVGVDIGCGMETVKIANKEIDLEKLDALIHEKIPSGFKIRETPHVFTANLELERLRAFDVIKYERAIRSIGTLGGGNHFIELAKSNNGEIYVVIHSGSRHLGCQIADYYQREAFARLNKAGKKDVALMIESLKASGRETEIQEYLKEMKNKMKKAVPNDLAAATDDLFDDYLHDMRIVQEFAKLNRKAMMDVIIEGMEFKVVDQFTTVHNYIDMDTMILRKGAVSAQKGEKLLIPINMRDGSLICVGKGNSEWNFSAPHGAGRLMSRSKAKQTFTMDEFTDSMVGIYTSSVSIDTLDECPMAYKDIDSIIKNIQPTADVIEIIKPIYNFKASE